MPKNVKAKPMLKKKLHSEDPDKIVETCQGGLIGDTQRKKLLPYKLYETYENLWQKMFMKWNQVYLKGDIDFLYQENYI